MPVIYPVPGEEAALARVLLSMVDDPHQIGVVNEGGTGFLVSVEVEQLWLDSLRPPEPEAAPEPEPESEVDAAPVIKNRKKG